MLITGLSDELLVEVFKRLGAQSAAGVCRAFRRVYREHATSVTLTHGYDPVLDAAEARALAACKTLRRFNAVALQMDAGRSPWPLRALTQLRSATLPQEYCPATEIPPSLASLELVGGWNWQRPRWMSALLAHLDAAASDCIVLVGEAPATPQWEVWKHPRIRARCLTYHSHPNNEALSHLCTGNLSCVWHLRVHRCSAVTSLSGLDAAQLPCLSHLSVLHCNALLSLEGLQNLSRLKLKHVEIVHCTSLTSLRFVECLPQLETCRLSNVGLRDLSGLAGARLASLASLTLTQCPNLASIQALGSAELPCLQHLELSNCTLLQDLTGLRGASFTAITGLNLEDCVGLTSLRGLEDAQLPALEHLVLAGCCCLVSLQGLDSARLGELELLDLESCTRLTSLRELVAAGFSTDIVANCPQQLVA